MHALVLPKICGKIRQAPVKLSEWPHLSNLPVADQYEERTLTIDVLIGLDYYFNLVGGDVRRGPAGGPVAIHSQLGWILCGQTSRRPTTAVTTLLTHVEESADQILRRFWELEAIGIATDNQTASPDEEALQRSEEGLTFDGERYEVHLPWLPSRPSLPNNFPQARRRLLAVERRLARCEEEKREYAATMRQYVENGWAERAPEIGLTTLYTKVRARRRSAELHCPGRQNPADLLSRGTTLPKLLESPLWWHGPKWLAHPHDAWPVGQPIAEDTSPMRDERSEQRVTVGVTAHVECNSIRPERYGCVERLFRITAYCQSFVRNCRLLAEARQSGALTVAELRKAEGTWVRMAQSEAFSSELQALSRKGRVVATSRLSRLNPFVDEEGFLRVGGRLENAQLPSHMKHPVILPGDHALTMGLIRRCHARQLHAGTTHTLAILRQAHPSRKSNPALFCLSACNGQTDSAENGGLAIQSSGRSRCFRPHWDGFRGALLIRVGKKDTSKCYVCLFTCMASRAVHLELVPQMPTARVMQALPRFIARRGRPEIIQSDNFRSFKAAASELRQLW
ncbi:hypothetical protein T08_6177 [Trichinella sp. T8]|nr:hypothetical protein T08_6177 [Trichinella sp. T8]